MRAIYGQVARAIRKMTTLTPGWIAPLTQPRTAQEAAIPSPSSSGGIDRTTSTRREIAVSTGPL